MLKKIKTDAILILILQIIELYLLAHKIFSVRMFGGYLNVFVIVIMLTAIMGARIIYLMNKTSKCNAK